MSCVNDNWKHRSVSMLCGKCMYWVEKPLSKLATPDVVPIGRCRRRAPELGGWPAVYANDWCGDHKIDEEK